MVQFLTNPQNLLVLLVCISAFATVLMVVTPFLAKDPLKGRMKSVALEREKMRDRERLRLNEQQKTDGSRASLKAEQKEFFNRIVNGLDLKKRLDDGTSAVKLAQAGKRGQQALMIFLSLKVLLPFAFAGGTAFYLYVLLPGTLQPMMNLGAIAMGGLFGFYAPNIYVSNAITKRQLNIRRAWPDSLDLLLICVESGMPIEGALKKVSDEIGTQSVALAEELLLTNAELSYLQERRQAYENLAKRTGLEPVKAVVTSLIQAEKYGTPLGTALRILAQENRDLRMMEAEKKAAGLPPKLTVPMIIFFLPCLFVVIGTPAYIQSVATLSSQ